MRLSTGISLLASAGTWATEFTPQHIFENPPAPATQFKIPTPYESAVQGRRILALTPLGTLSTVFPSSSSKDVSGQENRPSGLDGIPIGLVDYVADCEDSGNPTILAINIATSFKNVADGSNISLALQWAPPYPPDKRIKSTFFSRFFGREDKKEPVPYSAANLPRFSIIGYLEKMDEASAGAVSSCFVDTHPDSKYWLPGNRIHSSEFVRLVVQQVYWIGGFGDRAYIGWLDVDDWKSVTKDEWEAIRLPGEKKGWNEWSAWEL
ncbi:pyridoxamine 5'-phosphate oxidase-domain-containing protein [Xylariales sp. PMI_506]|nr:pyridoxamine 5'-phosphate oxidase-domain-containing protein [Xylariales sp. PMI_506]